MPVSLHRSPRTAIGLMSGTSMDGIDAAIIRSDGGHVIQPVDFITLSYGHALRDRLRGILGGRGDVAGVEHDLTQAHIEAVRAVMVRAGLKTQDVDVIGFHGHTIDHRPDKGKTWQIGDGRMMAEATGIAVVNDFRSADMDAGGQGAPLVPLFHRALAAATREQVAVLNIGGVANVTLPGVAEADTIAFDTGPGNALVDDLVNRERGLWCDPEGSFAASGKVDQPILDQLLTHPFFDAPPPKSLDRSDFTGDAVKGLAFEDAAATLTEFTVRAVAASVRHMPVRPKRWFVCGGGRHNRTMMAGLARALRVSVEPVETLGHDGDAIEAQAFAWMAVRHLDGLPLTLPSTTGVSRPMPGGVLHRPDSAAVSAGEGRQTGAR